MTKELKQILKTLNEACAIISEQSEKISELINSGDSITEPPKLSFKIKNVFKPADRLNELGEIPKLPNGQTDYWQAGKMLCEKDGGAMASMEDLAELASYIYDKEIEAYDDCDDLEVRNVPEELKDIEFPFWVWSGREYASSYAYYRNFNSTSSGWYGIYHRNYSSGLVLCKGD